MFGIQEQHEEKRGRKKKSSQAPMAHTCNPSYLGGSNLEDSGKTSTPK
jgi:hypothetical protein